MNRTTAWAIASGRDPQLYRAWVHMRGRCNSPSHKSYKNYGGRGITICARWGSFKAFAADVLATIGPHPGKGWSLDRKKNNQNYRRGNIRWATPSMQNRNMRRNKMNPRKVARLRALYATGEWTHRGLAAKFKIQHHTVSQIVRYEIWK